MEDKFPILHDPPLTVGDNRPIYVPWCIFIGHERQVDKNHGQTLERLAERGGLHPTESIQLKWHVSSKTKNLINLWERIKSSS